MIAIAGLVSACFACGEDDAASGRADSVSPGDDSPEVTAGDVAETTTATPDATDDSAADVSTSDTGPAPADVAPDVAIDDSPLGGARPARLVLPPDYVPGAPRPLVILLHGYSATGAIQDAYLGLSREAAGRGFISVVPDGTTNATGLQFWNADPGWCCNFGGSDVDDAGYLLGLVAEARARFTIDPARVYLVGHSNGGFMAHKMACDHADVFAAIASIAGSMPLAADGCAPSEPVSMLQIHGTSDATIAFFGSPGEYPSAETTAERWAGHDGCERLPQTSADRDYDVAVLGAETSPRQFPGCTAGAAVELWEMRGSGHIPSFNGDFVPAVLDWLLAHPRSGR